VHPHGGATLVDERRRRSFAEDGEPRLYLIGQAARQPPDEARETREEAQHCPCPPGFQVRHDREVDVYWSLVDRGTDVPLTHDRWLPVREAEVAELP
jgi:hypothetical protein